MSLESATQRGQTPGLDASSSSSDAGGSAGSTAELFDQFMRSSKSDLRNAVTTGRTTYGDSQNSAGIGDLAQLSGGQGAGSGLTTDDRNFFDQIGSQIGCRIPLDRKATEQETQTLLQQTRGRVQIFSEVELAAKR